MITIRCWSVFVCLSVSVWVCDSEHVKRASLLLRAQDEMSRAEAQVSSHGLKWWTMTGFSFRGEQKDSVDVQMVLQSIVFQCFLALRNHFSGFVFHLIPKLYYWLMITTINWIPLSRFLRLLGVTIETCPSDGSPNPPHSLPIAPAIVVLYDGTADVYE